MYRANHPLGLRRPPSCDFPIAAWTTYLGSFVLALYPREAEEGRGGETAFRVGDLPAAMIRLSAMGVSFPSGMEEFQTPTGRGRLARFRDPSGNKLELVERF